MLPVLRKHSLLSVSETRPRIGRVARPRVQVESVETEALRHVSAFWKP